MGKVILCETKEAKTPYIFTNTRVSIYSYEEACFYILTNPSLISMESFGEEFEGWLEKYLGMGELSEELKRNRILKNDVISYLNIFLRAYNYLEDGEIKLYFEKIKGEVGLPLNVKLKKQADAYVNFRKYVRAIRIYDQILEIEELDPIFISSVYHNKGVALAKNFEFEEAKESFLEGYGFNPNELTLGAYLSIFFMSNKVDEAKAEALKLGASEEDFNRILGDYEREEENYMQTEEIKKLDQALNDRQYGREREAAKKVMKLLNNFKEDYRKQTN